MFVSVIIPVFDHPGPLRLCLAALALQTYPRDRFEVIVVDNGPAPSLASVVGAHTFARLLHEPRPGSYAARNAGIREAKGDIMAFTDADCRPRPDWIERGVAQLVAQGGAGMVAGRIVIVTGTPPNAVERFAQRLHLQQETYVRHYHFGATANVFTTRAMFDMFGFFEERLYSGGDKEWGQMLHAAGLPQSYAANVVVEHPARRTVRSLCRRLRRITGGRFGRRHAPADAYLSPFHRKERRRFLRDFRLLFAGTADVSVRHRATLLYFFVLERLIVMAEWLRLAMGGKPIR